MMWNMHWKRLLATAMLLASATAASAQTPAALPQLDVATTRGDQRLTGAALDGLGIVTLAWSQFIPAGADERAHGRRFSASDTPLGSDIRFTEHSSGAREAVANERGDFIVIWNEAGIPQGALQRTSPVLRPLTLHFNNPVEDVAIDQAGNFVTVWAVQVRDGARVFGQRYNADGSKRGPKFSAATDLKPYPFIPRIAMNQRTGEFVVVWLAKSSDHSNARILAQRFGSATGRQGGELQVNTAEIGDNDLISLDVGCAEDDSFVVTWSRVRASADVFAQRFDNAGMKLGEEIVVGNTPSENLLGKVRLAVAPEGQFVTAWDDVTPPLFVRLYRKDGTPAGPSRELAATEFPAYQALSFGYNGTFVLAWTDFNGVGDPVETINYQRFAASPGVEPCLFRGGHFFCDTNSGGAPEVDHVFAIRGGTPLLGGDMDGDGRDDYCLFRGNRFDCDSGHDYGAAEFTALFGQPGDTPLLGDVDGDGRDEACVFRAGRFLCDTGHDGGAAETEIVFGEAGDRALLGDVNGDGRADACLVRSGSFQCDTAGNGGTAETVISFSLGGVPLLGDVDNDGRDDPCFFGTGAFRCDTAHNGGTAEVAVAVTGLGTPLIGNVDGL